MAYAAWVASNPYTVGQIARATTVQASGLVFRCTVAGTSAATQPAWPTDIGSTIVDGGVTWAAISSVYEELSVLAPNAIIELFQLQLVASLHGTSDTSFLMATPMSASRFRQKVLNTAHGVSIYLLQSLIHISSTINTP
jgi:hypothetical protein